MSMRISAGFNCFCSFLDSLFVPVFRCGLLECDPSILDLQVQAPFVFVVRVTVRS